MSAALEYHRATNVPAHGTDEAHFLDPATFREPFKEYGDAGRLPLEASAAGPLLRDGAGVVRSRLHPRLGRTIRFRAYSSAGALYPVEAYVASPEGLLSFDARGPDFAHLHATDLRWRLAEAAAASELAHAAAVVVLTGIHARTGWKYLERGYRHVWWDGGTMLANLLALAAADGLRPRLLTAFVDAEVNEAIGVDGVHEFALALVALGEAPRGEVAPSPNGAMLLGEPRAPRYPLAEAAHAESSLREAEAVRGWRSASPPDEPVLDRASLARAMRRRGSVREYGSAALPRDAFRELLAWSEAPIPADAPPVVRQTVTVAAVEGLAPGVYDAELGLVREHDEAALREGVRFAAMEQEHPALAAANVFQLVDVGQLVQALGPRGYRWAQLEAGIRAGRLQVGAFLHGWGAAGSTFFDEEVSRLLGTRESPLLMVAVGPRA
jgi:SagB-type dehydrogenase family enzyme